MSHLEASGHTPFAHEEPVDAAAYDVPEVRAALDGVADLDERPLAEHVGVLDAAHAALRRVLDAPGAAHPVAVSPTST